ncbi:MAG TPA: patatin-like phospholipase family protein [Thermomicrobiaceae bacterium]|nr:patatin-like phospholipase family protein [Thermomicrobiaceae bacterium]
MSQSRLRVGTAVPRVPREPSAERRDPSDGKVAPIIGGGAITGGAYGVGALRAVDLLLAGRTVNDFDVYVGTSSGSLLAALAANGIASRDMAAALLSEPPAGLPGIEPGMLLTPNLGGLVRSGAALSRRALELDSCERLILGEQGRDDVAISRAVAAWTALPVLYAPVRVRVRDRDLVDGGVSPRRRTSTSPSRTPRRSCAELGGKAAGHADARRGFM